jgi:hypothetical protein
MPKYETVGCPFCGDGVISIMVFGGCWQEKRGARSSLGKGKSVRKSAKQFVVQKDCPNCGAKSDAIEAKL